MKNTGPKEVALIWRNTTESAIFSLKGKYYICDRKKENAYTFEIPYLLYYIYLKIIGGDQ
jgi:hypothetical protein